MAKCFHLLSWKIFASQHTYYHQTFLRKKWIRVFFGCCSQEWKLFPSLKRFSKTGSSIIIWKKCFFFSNNRIFFPRLKKVFTRSLSLSLSPVPSSFWVISSSVFLSFLSMDFYDIRLKLEHTKKHSSCFMTFKKNLINLLV